MPEVFGSDALALEATDQIGRNSCLFWGGKDGYGTSVKHAADPEEEECKQKKKMEMTCLTGLKLKGRWGREKGKVQVTSVPMLRESRKGQERNAMCAFTEERTTITHEVPLISRSQRGGRNVPCQLLISAAAQ